VKRVADALNDPAPRDLDPLREALRGLSTTELDELFTSVRASRGR
jgi:hypothetical protein